jgi:hypothetical protein
MEGLLRVGRRPDLIPELDHLTVAEMDDGGMGSLQLTPPRGRRVMSVEVAEARFDDADGVPVSATLNLDAYGALFELDIWKRDFNPLQRLPREGDVVEFRFNV